MTLTVSDVYSVRFGQKLPLPRVVQDKIARLRITPVPYKPVRSFTRHTYRPRYSHATVVENWRERALADIVRRVREREDPEYSDIFSIFNKISPGNIEKLSHDALVLMQKRDEQFRLRITALLFDKAITQSSFSAIMADCAFRLNQVIPEIAEDLQTQITMFPKLYNMSETITFPDSKEPGFDEKVIEWTKQKEKRRGYAKFMMELFAKNLISEASVQNAFEQVLRELNDTAKQPMSPQTEENTTQFASFLFECTKNPNCPLKNYLKDSIQTFLAIPRPEVPSMNMRSRFKLEDAFKELNKKD